MIGGRRISGFVITYNEEDDIRACLESMKWVDELVVVDSFSTDRTVEIAREFTDRIIQREFAGYVGQTRFAFEQTTGEWVLWLDADERLTPEAFEAARRELEQPGGPACDGFAFPRKTFFMDRWIRHGGWYPQHKLRLFRREVGAIAGEAADPRAEVPGRVKKLKGDILHYSYPGGLADCMKRALHYAQIWARVKHEAGERATLIGIFAKPPLVFLKSYILQLGVLDGVAGLAVAVGTALHKFLRNALLYELWHRQGQGDEGEE